jgi:lysylphosphatidylglycerol synthetase-like protein (DUF2156 family)
LRCGAKLYLYEGACSGDCPEGWRGRNRECYNESDDMRVLWFPFLITAFILTIVVFFGRLKTKAVLKNGKTTYISNQWSVVTIIALVAIVLSLAFITQVALAIFYWNAAVFVLSLIILLAMIGFNVYWAVWYYRNYFATRKPDKGERITVKGRTFDVQTDKQVENPENR